jgi:hypothetical protein
MEKNIMKLNKWYLCFVVVLLAGVGLACDAVTGGTEATVEVGLTPIGDVGGTAEGVPESLTPFPTLAEAVEEFENISAAHEENPVYPDTGAPPPGGPHNPAWQNCGVYTEPVETRHVLHSLEHGAVWLAYDPELPEADVTLLQDLAKEQAYTVMSPYPGLRSAVVLTAWGVQFETDTAADPRILEFLLTYQQGPQTPELGAPCQGGTGSPQAPGLVGSG